MKKKILAGLCAGALFCGMVSAPVSAWETKYSKGDVNMNGEIDLRDCRDVLIEYTYYYVCGIDDHYLTDEKIELADIIPGGKTKTMVINRKTGETKEITSRITLLDCQLLMKYYTYGMVDETVREKDVVEWAREISPHLFAE